jgi:hypothetical protein
VPTWISSGRIAECMTAANIRRLASRLGAIGKQKHAGDASKTRSIPPWSAVTRLSTVRIPSVAPNRMVSLSSHANHSARATGALPRDRNGALRRVPRTPVLRLCWNLPRPEDARLRSQAPRPQICHRDRARTPPSRAPVHVHYKPLYEAIGEPDNRHRKTVSLGRMIERLMILDAVLADHAYTWLGTERDKTRLL